MLGFNDDITSPLSAQIFDFCNPQLFQETSVSDILEKSGSFQDNNRSSFNTYTTTVTENNNNTDLDIEHLLTATSQDQFDHLLTATCQVIHHYPSNNLYSKDPLALPEVSSVAPPPLQFRVFEEDCLSSVPSYNLGLNPFCSFLRTSGLPEYMVNMSTGLLSYENNSGYLPGNIHLGPEINKSNDQLMDFQADQLMDFNSEDLQAFGGVENQAQFVVSKANPVLGPVEISGLEDSTLNKVGKLSVEQRKEKIHRYMKKRNKRNFNKKIKYACRKTLADSRPRVRGRFAKNDEFGESNRQASLNHHDDEDEEDRRVKDEEQLVDSSDMFAFISGANSFKCNYPMESWIEF